jgi:hypothetical protein
MRIQGREPLGVEDRACCLSIQKFDAASVVVARGVQFGRGLIGWVEWVFRWALSILLSSIQLINHAS